MTDAHDMPNGASQPRERACEEAFLGRFLPARSDLYVYILSLVGNRVDAEDVLQETSMRLWQKFADFRAEGDFRNWAFGVAMNVVRNFWRTRGRDRLRFDDDVVSAIVDVHVRAADEWDERRSALRRCIGRLSAPEQDLLSACYANGVQIRAVAEQLGRTANAVSKQLGLIRRKLFHCLDRGASSSISEM